MKHSLTNRKQGFTLVELMVSLTVFSILSTVGIPGVVRFVSDNKLSNAGLMLYSDILLARSEALKRKQSVYLCRSDNVLATTPVCGGDTQTWTEGWLLFVDGTGGTTATYEPATDTVLKIGQNINKNILIISSASADTILEYQSNGSLNPLVNEAIFTICDDRDGDSNYDEEYGREIRISSIGKASLKAKNVTSCEISS